VCLKSMVSREKEIFGDKFLGVALEKDAEMWKHVTLLKGPIPPTKGCDVDMSIIIINETLHPLHVNSIQNPFGDE
jgi:hypothetical protein